MRVAQGQRRLVSSLWASIAILVGGMHCAEAAPPANGWTLVWSDEFNESSLNTSTWGYFTGTNQGGYDDSGPPTIALSGGALNITTWTDSGGVVHTGWIGSYVSPGFSQVYGYWESNIQFNESSGEWSAFWLQSSAINTVTTPADPADNGAEIDIVEHRSTDTGGDDLTNYAYEQLHWDGYGSSEVSQGPGFIWNPGGASLQGNFHAYGLCWTPQGYTFYVDGTPTGSSSSGVSMRPEWVYLSTFVNGSSWAGPLINYGSSSSSTTKMQVGYVRWYSPSERILDADFEGRLAPWAGGNCAWVTGANGTIAYSGTTACFLNPTSSAAATVSQTVYGLVPNTGYVLTGWGKGNVFIGVNSYGGNQVGQTIINSGYAQATVPFTTGSTNTTAYVTAYAGPGTGTSYVDDFLLLRDATVNNGQLETGDTWAWDFYGGAVVSNDAAYGGNYCAALPAATVPEGAQQQIVGLTPNTTYSLSACAMTSGSPVVLGVNGYGGSQVTTSAGSSGFTRGVVNFTTGASNTTATVFAYRPATSTGTGYADDFFLFQPLPSPWADQDVTAISLSGTAGVIGSTFVVQASGANIGGTSDEFHFVNQQLTGNCQITARILASDNTSPAEQTGVMMRASAHSYVNNIMVDWTPAGTVNLVARTGGDSTNSATLATVTGVTQPPWVRLMRRGNVFTGFYSNDGNTWTQIGTPQTISLPGTAFVGLAVCADNTADLANVVFSNVSTAAFNGSDTWAGGGGNANWQTVNNWSGTNDPPLAGDPLFFDGTAQLNNTNNFPAFTSFSGITFNATAGAFALAGNAVNLTGAVTNNSPNLETIDFGLQLPAGETFTSTAGPILVGGSISGAGGVTETGSGIVSLSGANTYTGTTNINSGVLDVTGTIGATATIAVGSNATSQVGALYQSGSTSLVANTNSVLGAFQIGSVPGAIGYYNLSGGTINVVGEIDPGGSGGGAGTFGEFDMSGGTVNLPNSTSSYFLPDRGAAGEVAVVNISGGTIKIAGGGAPANTNINGLAVGLNNVGNLVSTVTISGAGQFLTPSLTVKLNDTSFGGTPNSTNVSALNMDGGTLQTLGFGSVVNSPGSVAGNGYAVINFNGGTIMAGNAGNTSFLEGLGAVYVYSGGGKINNNGQAITIGQALLAPTGYGVSLGTLSVTGSGFLAPPIVTVGGNGSGATAFATIDGYGNLTGVTLTNPGVGYAGTPTFAFTGGGATVSQSGNATTTANIGGGMTFEGGGATTLTGANTYTGGTTITTGTVIVGKASALGAPPNAALTFGAVSTGALELNGYSITLTDLTTNALNAGSPIIENGASGAATLTVKTANNDNFAGTLENGGAGALALTVGGKGTLTLSGSITCTGATKVTGGVLELAGTLSNTSSLVVENGAVFYLAGGSLSVTGAITNYGIFKLSGSTPLLAAGSFVNNGVLDLINGPQTLPSNFTNNGTVLTSSVVQLQQMVMSGSSFTVTIQSYAQHTYQMQRTSSLLQPWTNVGASQAGNGSVLVFTDSGATTPQGFYRVQVSP